MASMLSRSLNKCVPTARIAYARAFSSPSSAPLPNSSPSSSSSSSSSKYNPQQLLAEAIQRESATRNKIRRKNMLLGAGLVAFVGGIYFYSIFAVRHGNDTIHGSDMAEINKELDEEEEKSRLVAQQKLLKQQFNKE
jgi:hypothetical protein